MLSTKAQQILDKIRHLQETAPFESLSLSDILSREFVPVRNNPARGFRYGSELVGDIRELNGKAIRVPRIHYFASKNVWATAIEESEEGADLLLDLALHAIVSYPLGDAEVYMMDSDIRGPFCGLHEISSNINETQSHLNLFHYVTTTEDRESVIKQLEKKVENNILKYLKGYDALVSYNINSDKLIQPYTFLFVRDIGGVFKDSFIRLLVNMTNNNNATCAGVYVFYSYKKKDLEGNRFDYTGLPLRTLLANSVCLTDKRNLKSGSKKLWDSVHSKLLVDKVIEHFKRMPTPDNVITFKQEIDEMLKSKNLWKSNEGIAIDSITMPLGYKDAVNKLEISFKLEGSPHAYVAGNTGYGKTILLHNIILNSALRYSPAQLQFYLIDMKAGGQSFVFYKNLPHVRALSDSASRFFALSVLQNLAAQIEKRGQLITECHTTRIDEYNRKALEKGEPILPFIIVILDEFQVLLNGDSKAREGAKLLNYVLQQGRSMGVFLVLCSQKIRQDGLELAQIKKKICVQLSSSDSEKLIGNNGASKLTQVGMAILNEAVDDKYGASNQKFQVAFIDENNDLDKYVNLIQKIYLKKCKGKDALEHIIFDGARLSDNAALPRNPDDNYIYVGVPAFCRKRHAGFYLQRATKSNVVIVGNDKASALRLLGIIAIQFRELYADGNIYLSDFQSSGDDTCGILDFLANNDSHVHLSKAKDFVPQTEKPRSYLHKAEDTAEKDDVLSGLKKMLEDRKNDSDNLAHHPETLFVVINPQPNALRSDILLSIMNQGPFYGIHVLIWLHNSINSKAILGKAGIDCSEVKISLFGGSPLKAFKEYSNDTEQVDKNGTCKLHIPLNMGLTYDEGELPGDLFDVYREVGDCNLSNNNWHILFSKLVNIKEKETNRFD